MKVFHFIFLLFFTFTTINISFSCDNIQLVYEGEDHLIFSLEDSCPDDPEIIRFESQYKAVGDSWMNYQEGNISSTNSYPGIFDLQPCTDYEVRFRIKCNGVYGEWCNFEAKTSGTFCEPDSCENIQLVNEEEDRLVFSLEGSCEDSLGRILFDSQYKINGDSWVDFHTDATVMANYPYPAILSLQPCTDYEVRFRIKCNGVYGEWCSFEAKTSCTSCGSEMLFKYRIKDEHNVWGSWINNAIQGNICTGNSDIRMHFMPIPFVPGAWSNTVIERPDGTYFYGGNFIINDVKEADEGNYYLVYTDPQTGCSSEWNFNLIVDVCPVPIDLECRYRVKDENGVWSSFVYDCSKTMVQGLSDIQIQIRPNPWKAGAYENTESEGPNGFMNDGNFVINNVDMNDSGEYDFLYTDPDTGVEANIVFELNVLAMKKSNLDKDENDVFNFYPNPNNGIVYFNTLNKVKSKIELSIYDMNGKLRKQILLYTNNSKVKLNLDELEQGTYFFELKCDEFFEIHKLLIKPN